MVKAHECGERGRIRLHCGAGTERGHDFVVNVFQYAERSGPVRAVECAKQGVDRLQRHQRPRGEVRDDGAGVGSLWAGA